MTGTRIRSPKARKFNFELADCAIHGHVLAGEDVDGIRPEDANLVREDGTLRWHRCLRCDSWVPKNPPVVPTREVMPDRHDIHLPLRGRPLRDRFILRLIAIDRAIHVLVLGSLAGLVFFYAADRSAIQPGLTRVLSDLQGGVDGPGVHQGGLLGDFGKALTLKEQTLWIAGVVLTAYAILEGTEMVGLWLTKRWAEYLTFVATTVLLPVEIYELTHGVSVLKLLTLLINLAVVVYLLWAKRLFGLRGGGRREREDKLHDLSWEAFEAAGPARGRISPAPSQPDRRSTTASPPLAGRTGSPDG